MKITYWSDYACPYCYIGETYLKQAIADLGIGDQVEVEMKAFELDPEASKDYTGATVDRFAKKYGLSKQGAQARIDGISQMGREAGLDFQYAETRYTNTFDAHRLTKLAQKKDRILADRLSERLYKAYFSEGLELADHEVLLRIALEEGMSAFENCYSLQELTIPSSVKQVDGFAFKGCTGLKKLTLKSAFKGFEKAFPDSNEVSEVYITESAAGKAHLVFPKATIFSLRGKKLFSPAKASSKVGGAEAEKNTSDKKELISSAVNGELVPNSGIKKFKNYAVDINGLKYSFHVEFRGSQIANRICKACYSGATKGEVSEKLFDAVELLRANLALYTVEPHTGVRIPTLSEDYEMMGEKRSYSIPLESDEIIEYVTRFSTELSCCLTTKSIAKIIEYVPHKKNGMLAKSRITMVLKAGWSDSEGYTPVLIAKNVADNDLVLEVKTIYIGEEKYDESEAARVIGIVGSAPTRKDKAREKA